jgi:hypothetical protein
MFNVQSAKQQIEKSKIEIAILKAKMDFWAKLSDENEMGYTDKAANNILEGYSTPSDATPAELETIKHFRNKIESLENQLCPIA